MWLLFNEWFWPLELSPKIILENAKMTPSKKYYISHCIFSFNHYVFGTLLIGNTKLNNSILWVPGKRLHWCKPREFTYSPKRLKATLCMARAVKVWSQSPQLQCHPGGTCQQRKFSAPVQTCWIKSPGDAEYFHKLPRWLWCTLTWRTPDGSRKTGL